MLPSILEISSYDLSKQIHRNYYKDTNVEEWNVLVHPEEAAFLFGKIEQGESFLIELGDNEVVYVSAYNISDIEEEERITKDIILNLGEILEGYGEEVLISSSRKRSSLFANGKKTRNILSIVKELNNSLDFSLNYLNHCWKKGNNKKHEFSFNYDAGSITIWEENAYELRSIKDVEAYLGLYKPKKGETNIEKLLKFIYADKFSTERAKDAIVSSLSMEQLESEISKGFKNGIDLINKRVLSTFEFQLRENNLNNKIISGYRLGDLYTFVAPDKVFMYTLEELKSHEVIKIK